MLLVCRAVCQDLRAPKIARHIVVVGMMDFEFGLKPGHQGLGVCLECILFKHGWWSDTEVNLLLVVCGDEVPSGKVPLEGFRPTMSAVIGFLGILPWWVVTVPL